MDRHPILSTTIRQIDEQGRDLMPWCFACERGERVDAIIWQLFEERGWPMDLHSAASRFRCKACGSSDDVRLYPVRRPDRGPFNGEQLVASMFHAMRCKRR